MSGANASRHAMTTPAGIRLCSLETIADGAARNFVVQLDSARFHGFVVRRGDTVTGYVDRCPHAGWPLAQRLDDYLTPDGALIACDWHGALFEIDTGFCIAGPCKGARLSAWPVEIVQGWVLTADNRSNTE